MTDLFRVAISGQRISGKPLDEIREDVGKAFGLQGEQLDRMLCGRPVVVAKAVTPQAADKLLSRLQRLDLEATKQPLEAPPAASSSASPSPPQASQSSRQTPAARPMASFPAPSSAAPPAPAASSSELFALAGAPAEDSVVCPKCGEQQPKRTLCRQCGLDMPRHHAAQAEAARQAKEEREAALAAKANGAAAGSIAPAYLEGPRASVFGFGFGGRLGRLGYLSGSLLSFAMMVIFFMLAAGTGKISLAGLGMVLSSVYGMRCIALRLHDTGRSGWLALLVLVPLVGALMTLALLILSGEDQDNEYGPPPDGPGPLFTFIVFIVTVGLFSAMVKHMTKNPENLQKYMKVIAFGQPLPAGTESDASDGPGLPAAARYAPGNRIDLYVIAGCEQCDEMQQWIGKNGLRATIYHVDSDQHAAERLQSILGNDGSVQLPVLEVNGKVLPGNPSIADVHRHLRQEP